MWDICATKWPSVPRTPASGHVRTDLGQMFTDRTKLARFVPLWNEPTPEGLRFRACPRRRRIPSITATTHHRAGRRGDARTRSPAASASSSPPGARRRPPDHDGRDRRGGRRRTLDALPPLRHPRGSVRRTRARGRTTGRASPDRSPRVGSRRCPTRRPAASAASSRSRSRSRTSSTRSRRTSSPTSSWPRRAAPRASPSPCTSSTSMARSSSGWRAPRTSPRPWTRRRRWGPRSCPRDCRRSTSALKRRLPRCVATPLWLRGRVIGLLLCVGAPVAPLEDIAKQGAAALELANDYTDVIEAARRRKPTTAAAEVQYHLLPPRVARVTGAQIAGALLPAYEVGGDWFDFVENRDGSWLAIADTAGTGPDRGRPGRLRPRRAARCAAQRPGSGAGRPEHRRGRPRAGQPSFVVTAVLARWHAPTATLAWLNCGHPPAYVVDGEGGFTELEGPVHAALGAGDEPAELRGRRRQPRARGPSRALHRRDHGALRQGRRPVRRRRDAAGGPGRQRAHGGRHGDGHPGRRDGAPRPIRSRTTRRSSSSPSTERPLQDLSRVSRFGATCRARVFRMG